MILSHVCEGNNENTFCSHYCHTIPQQGILKQLKHSFCTTTEAYKNSKFVSFWSILSFYFLRKKILQIKNGKAWNLTTGFSLVSCNYDPPDICHTIIARPLGSSTVCTFRNTGICNHKDVKSENMALKLFTHINWPSFYESMTSVCVDNIYQNWLFVRIIIGMCKVIFWPSWDFFCTGRWVSTKFQD